MWIRTSLSGSKGSEQNSSTSSSSTMSSDETTALLPHERGPGLESQDASSTQLARNSSTDTRSLNTLITLHQQDSFRRAEEEETEAEAEDLHLTHVLSRIDTIEIGLWRTRIRESEAQEFGERLSRVDTCVCSATNDEPRYQRKSSAASALTSLLSPTPRYCPHPFFWFDVAGIAILGSVVLALIVFVVISIKDSGKGKALCGHKEEFWGAVNLLVALFWGLVCQVPVKRWIVPFVLPTWVVLTFWTVVFVRRVAGC